MQKPNKKLVNSLKKWTTLITILLILFVAQSSNFLFSFNNIKPVLILPFALGFAMFSKQKNAAIFGIICGFFLDCFSERYFGTSSLLLLIICVSVSLIYSRYMRIRFLNFVFLTAISLAIFELTNLLILYISSNFKNVWFIWLDHNLKTAAFTVLVSPIFYLINKKIYYIFDKNKLISTD